MRPNVNYRNGRDVTLPAIQQALRNAADSHGISVAFRNDEVKYGVFGGKEPCLVLYHPAHEKDYYNVCIRVKHEGNYAFVSVNDFGTSTQIGNAGSKDYLKETMKNGDGWTKAGALLGAGVRRLVKGGVNKQKLEEEQRWYAVIIDLFDEILD